jgi:hypothetical protein
MLNGSAEFFVVANLREQPIIRERSRVVIGDQQQRTRRALRYQFDRLLF